jgi:hypothetical protein
MQLFCSLCIVNIFGSGRNISSHSRIISACVYGASVYYKSIMIATFFFRFSTAIILLIEFSFFLEGETPGGPCFPMAELRPVLLGLHALLTRMADEIQRRSEMDALGDAGRGGAGRGDADAGRGDGGREQDLRLFRDLRAMLGA